jgi:hypothetical protein
MMKRYFKMFLEYLRKVAALLRDWDAWLPIFLPSYGTTTHDTTGFTPAKLEFGRELRLPCDLLFAVRLGNECPTVDYREALGDPLHDTPQFARQHLKLAHDRMKTLYDRLAKFEGYQEEEKVWLHGLNRTNGKFPKLRI